MVIFFALNATDHWWQQGFSDSHWTVTKKRVWKQKIFSPQPNTSLFHGREERITSWTSHSWGRVFPAKRDLQWSSSPAERLDLPSATLSGLEKLSQRHLEVCSFLFSLYKAEKETLKHLILKVRSLKSPASLQRKPFHEKIPSRPRVFAMFYCHEAEEQERTSAR